ncbi:SLATT domain-containing protein [Motilibacter deserti]|uniref:SLATT domain-containing protein n=1 Tax=Motilibacter deserti TaxID=2714956 RepID=A0ABX0GUF1_9ACTN|nr:SLATT domain-containing protein [Motilibacter deserti]NHC14138.1 SLATT domain-containing protein [Motilibacter deserti]
MTTPSTTQTDALMKELERVRVEALYSAQAYYEASKRLERQARYLIFWPACVSAASAFAVAVGAPKWLGGVAALASIMAATANLMGADRKPAAYRKVAGEMTALRHKIALEIALAQFASSIQALEEITRRLAAEYQALASIAEPTSNRDYKSADKRIKAGVFG